MIINKTTLQTISEYDFRRLHPNISFPTVLTDNILQSHDHTIITEPSPPVTTKYQTPTLKAPYRNASNVITLEWEVTTRTPTLPELLLEYEVAIDAVLDAKAKEYRYNNVYTMISYRGDSNPTFANEAESMFQWRSRVWTKANADIATYLADVAASPLNPPQPPTVASVLATMPVWILL